MADFLTYEIYIHGFDMQNIVYVYFQDRNLQEKSSGLTNSYPDNSDRPNNLKWRNNKEKNTNRFSQSLLTFIISRNENVFLNWRIALLIFLIIGFSVVGRKKPSSILKLILTSLTILSTEMTNFDNLIGALSATERMFHSL